MAAAVVAAAATMTATGRRAPPSGHSTGAGAAHLGHVVGQTLQLPPALCRPCRQAQQHHMHGILHQRLVPRLTPARSRGLPACCACRDERGGGGGSGGGGGEVTITVARRVFVGNLSYQTSWQVGTGRWATAAATAQR